MLRSKKVNFPFCLSLTYFPLRKFENYFPHLFWRFSGYCKSFSARNITLKMWKIRETLSSYTTRKELYERQKKYIHQRRKTFNKNGVFKKENTTIFLIYILRLYSHYVQICHIEQIINLNTFELYYLCITLLLLRYECHSAAYFRTHFVV